MSRPSIEPARRSGRPGQPVEQCRLACPVRTDQPDDLPLGDLEVDAVDGAQPAERHGQCMGFQAACHFDGPHAAVRRVPSGAKITAAINPTPPRRNVKSLEIPKDFDEERPEQSPGDDDAADDRPGDGGDAAEVGVGEEHERLQVVEAVG